MTDEDLCMQATPQMLHIGRCMRTIVQCYAGAEAVTLMRPIASFLQQCGCNLWLAGLVSAKGSCALTQLVAPHPSRSLPYHFLKSIECLEPARAVAHAF